MCHNCYHKEKPRQPSLLPCWPLFIDSLLSAVFVEVGRLPKACGSLPVGPDSWFSTTHVYSGLSANPVFQRAKLLRSETGE